MMKDTIEIDDFGKKIEFKARRIQLPSNEEKLRLYVIKDGEEILVLEEFLSNIAKRIRRIINFGITTNPIIENDLLDEIYRSYTEFPIVKYLKKIGYLYDDSENILGYSCGKYVKENGILEEVIQEKNMPKVKGEAGQTIINNYMENNVVRQTVLLHQLAAPINGLFNQCSLMALVGPSSYGKTTLAKLAQSFFGDTRCQKNNYVLNATVSGAEEALAGINGYAVLFDDDGMVTMDKSFKWQEAIFRLEGGIIRLRHEKKGRKDEDIANENFCVNILFTAENSILDSVDSRRKGANARLIEIEIGKENKNMLFDTYGQCKQIEMFFQNNYGNIVPLIMQKIFSIGIENVKNMVLRKEEEIANRLETKENIVKRYFRQFAIMEVTAEIAKKIGLDFDKESITDFLKSTIEQSLSKPEKEDSEEFFAIFQNEVIASAIKKNRKKDDGTYLLCGEEIKEIIDSLLIRFPQNKINTPNLLIKQLAENGVIKRVRGNLSAIHTYEKESIRAYCIVAGKEEKLSD